MRSADHTQTERRVMKHVQTGQEVQKKKERKKESDQYARVHEDLFFYLCAEMKG